VPAGYDSAMTENSVPPTEPDDISEPDETPATPLEPSVTNPDADGTDDVPS
jgi:hypothetical protein